MTFLTLPVPVDTGYVWELQVTWGAPATVTVHRGGRGAEPPEFLGEPREASPELAEA